MQATLETLTADLRLALGDAGTVVNAAPIGQPRFELFHGANSICSQKVRVVLAHHAIAYTSHEMNIFVGQSYLPSHVRLRMIGCEAAGMDLMTTHDGSTSATHGGCDPAVVPTLVDRDEEEVIVDSKRICLYLDETMPKAQSLLPAHLAAAIHAEIDIVDNLPNYQMLTGRKPGGDARPEKLRHTDGVDFSTSKAARCDRYMAEFADEPALVRAYAAKRSKELQGAANLFSADAMTVAYAKADAACATLDGKLAGAPTAWLVDDALTMADLFWAVEVLRMKNVGAGPLWENGRMPALSRFVDAAERLPSIRSAVLDWPGATF